MRLRYILPLFALAAISIGCRKKDLSDYPGYVDPSHVLIFGEEGQSWQGIDITETTDGRYVVVGEAAIFKGNDPVSSAIGISVSEHGDSLWLYKSPFYRRYTDVESIGNGKVAARDYYGLQIIDSSGKPLYRIPANPESYGSFTLFDNDQIIYDPRTNAIVSFYSDTGLCLKQVPIDGSSGWLACSGIGNSFGTEIVLTDRGYVALAETVGGLLLFAVDTHGILVWVDTLKIPEEYTESDSRTFLKGFTLTEDGGYMIAGKTWLSVGWYPYIIKLDSNRNVKWIKMYDRPGDEIEKWNGYPMDILKLGNGTYVVIGMNMACPGGYCGAMMRIDSHGNVLRARNYFMWSGDMSFWNGIVASDGNVVVTGGTLNRSDETQSYYVFIFKFTPDGEPVW